MPYQYEVTPVENHTVDRVFKIELIDDKAPISSTGLVDKRLFSGDNKLHAIMDIQSTLWSMQYEKGALPEALRTQRFTTLGKLRAFLEDYFAKRNIKITEVSD